MGKKTQGSVPRIDHPGLGVLEFPWDQADALWKAAEKAGINSAKQTILHIRDMLGHPEAIAPITTAWANSKSKINDSTDGSTGLNSAKNNMQLVWEGHASEAAVKYVDDLVKVSGETEDILKDMITSINSFSEHVVNTYKICLDLINVYADYVLNIAKSVLDNWKDWFGMGSALADTLKEFVGKVKEAVDKFIDNTAKARNTIVELQVKASGLKVPEPIAPIAFDTGSWRPKQAS
ncbi:hypothetical protein ABZ894_28845 [Nocardia beijingensis]|uniref:hypothetical protein n=1 Tax=Nocardia beijingensis TaxID=95162 RepID=UPI0033F273D2